MLIISIKKKKFPKYLGLILATFNPQKRSFQLFQLHWHQNPPQFHAPCLDWRRNISNNCRNFAGAFSSRGFQPACKAESIFRALQDAPSQNSTNLNICSGRIWLWNEAIFAIFIPVTFVSHHTFVVGKGWTFCSLSFQARLINSYIFFDRAVSP